eukprot:TRINITY_DN10473_c0_g1_i2.p2 TRINITY_DN10473_c0_g1~~TRINITY_DN10473_c0_g1_i2.p2  ORF type:complete len:129 (+),score=24.68 TRINITY_DN10473_c0_g1_i2:758-1144(+)
MGGDPLVEITEIEVEQVTFRDTDGDTLIFKPAGGGMAYSLNGTDRPVFTKMKWAPAMGVAGITMPDIQKGFPLPHDGLKEILGGLRFLAKQTGVEFEIPEKIQLPTSSEVALPNELADSLLSARTQQG